MQKTLSSIASAITTLALRKVPIIVGIDGRSGSGKSTLALSIKKKLTRVQIVETDYFYYQKRQITRETVENDYNYDWKRLECTVLHPLTHGKDASYKRALWDVLPLVYDGKNHTVLREGVILIEGFSSLRQNLRNYFDYKIWVEKGRAKCLENVLAREKQRQPEKTRHQLLNEWKAYILPVEERYIRIENPQKDIDAVFISDG